MFEEQIKLNQLTWWRIFRWLSSGAPVPFFCFFLRSRPCYAYCKRQVTHLLHLWFQYWSIGQPTEGHKNEEDRRSSSPAERMEMVAVLWYRPLDTNRTVVIPHAIVSSVLSAIAAILIRLVVPWHVWLIELTLSRNSAHGIRQHHGGCIQSERPTNLEIISHSFLLTLLT